MNPTPEQNEIIGAAASSTRSLMISALAGCAKTTTIKLLAPVLPTKSILAVAFNKKIAEDLAKALPPHVTCATLNSLGHRAFGQAIGRRLQVDSGKLSKLVTAYSKSLGGGLSDDEWANLRNLVGRARASGLVPTRYPQSRKSLLSDDTWGWDIVAEAVGIDLTEELLTGARQVLCDSIDQALSGLIDYDDQIYMSVLFSGLYPKFHTVLVDEAQDLSPLNHLQLKKMVRDRLIVVGDPKQAIYAFRGADSSSMEKIRELREEWINLPLTLTFRCPKAIVTRQHHHAPEFRAADSAPDGEVYDYRQEKEWTIALPKPIDITRIEKFIPNVRPDSGLAILCRNNSPLVSLAFKLIKKRIGINMLGRDFGKSLTSLLKKVCGEDQTLPAEEVAKKVSEWMEREARLARANDKPEKLSRVTDQGESILAIIDSGEVRTLSDIKSWLVELFEEKKGQVTLASGHKAKGLEWHTVIHLDPWRVPSKYARLAADDGNHVPMQQELNLKYVIETRAKHTLVLANLESFT